MDRLRTPVRRLLQSGAGARLRPRLPELTRFGIVGLAGLVVTDGGANLLRYQAGTGRLFAVAAATVVATGVTFVGSRYWTYRHRERTGLRREAALFAGVNGAGLIISLAPVELTYPLHLDGGVAYNVAVSLGIVLGTLFRYWTYRTWVWRTDAAPTRRREPRHAPARTWALVFDLVKFAVISAGTRLAPAALVLALTPGAQPVAVVTIILVPAALSFVGNRYWTFRRRARTALAREAGLYLALYVAAVLIQEAVFQFADTAGISVVSAASLAAALSYGLQFWWCRAWVWRTPRMTSPAAA